MDFVKSFDFTSSPTLSKRVKDHLKPNSIVYQNSKKFFTYYHCTTHIRYHSSEEIVFQSSPVYYFVFNEIFIVSNTIHGLKNATFLYWGIPVENPTPNQDIVDRIERLNCQIKKLETERDYLRHLLEY